MRVIKSLILEEKEAKLVLLDDEVTVQVIYAEQIISSSAGSTWDNLKDEPWAQEGILRIEVESFIRKQKTMKELENVAKEYF